MTLRRYDDSENFWISASHGNEGSTALQYVHSGNHTLTDPLTTVQMTTSGGTATFDAGAIRLIAKNYR